MLTGVIALFVVASIFFVQREINKAKMMSAHEQWQEKRISDLLEKESSWLNLAGLFWMEEGEWTIGFAQDNDFVLQEGNAAEQLGTFIREGDQVYFDPPEAAEVMAGDEVVSERITLIDDEGGYGDPTVLSYGPLQWWVITRDGLIGVRVRNLESEHHAGFEGIDSFPFNADWQMEAQFLPFDEARKFEYPTILGTMREEAAPGMLVFEIEGRQFEMIPFEREGGSRLFLVFGDQTNGTNTYEGGRFLYVNMPDETGKTIIDFNRAYNPPCAFSPYSTCPQPLRQNRLSFSVDAGELVYKKGSTTIANS